MASGAPLHFGSLALRVLLVVAAAFSLGSCTRRVFQPPERLGPPALVMHEDEPRLWLSLKQEEQRHRQLGGGRFSTGRMVMETFYHFDVQAHDARTTDRVWKKRLLTMRDNAGGHNAELRILGQDGEIVWLFLHDQPIALSTKDGSQVADGNLLQQRNPSLQGVLAKELKFYAFDGGLVITTADARRYKVRAADFTIVPYQPVSDDRFRRMQFMATQWNGGYGTGDFLTRRATQSDRWLGFFSEKEAAEAGDDGFGDHYKNPDSVLDEGARARRTFWTARIGRTKEFSEGSHDRLFDLRKVPGAPEYLEAGLLIQQGTKEPLRLKDPAGFLVLHKTRLDAEGQLALTRLDDALREKWTAKLPMVELRNRFEFPERLLLYGTAQRTEKGVTRREELIVALDLRDGSIRAWNVPREQFVAALEKE